MEQTIPTSEAEKAVLIPPRTLAMFSTDCVYGVRAHDPLTFLATAGALLAAATVAYPPPERRATRIDPCVTLREG
jgi:hypothetical protein